MVNAGTSVTTGTDGTFEIHVSPGVYDLRFTPPSNSGLRSYLATGVDATSTASLRIILKPITVIHLEGVVRDGNDNHYPRTSLTFIPAAGGPATSVTADTTGHYSVELLAGQYRISAFHFPGTVYSSVNFKNPVDFEQSQTYDVVMPMSTLTVSVRDLDGKPVTDASIASDPDYPSTADYSGFTFINPAAVDTTTGDVALNMITGTKPQNARITLKSGLTVPFAAPTVDHDQSIAVTIPRSIHLEG
ncbi:hypothetical protein ACGFI9_36020, partial [Micromonospora sp. NPDC048930]|uniref:hypothetical protein n=1 Tax=Micromonospora sp. NPDC048930 TaxID=3364261 RepID=UPI0037180C69